MKNFTLVALCAAAGLACSAAPVQFKTAMRAARPATASAKPSTAKKAAEFRSPKANPVWRPGTSTVYGWDGAEWQLNQTYKTTYTAAGHPAVDLITEASGEITRETNSYNSDNLLISQLSEVAPDGTNFENSEKVERAYDERLVNVIAHNYEWLWMGDEWAQLGNNYRRIITRDQAGNITKVVIATLYQGEFDPSREINITYGADGKATVIAEKELTFDGVSLVWEDGITYKDIVWENTDGQIYQAEGLTFGANRVKTATIVSEELEIKMSNEYFPDSEKYVSTMTVEEEGMTSVAVAVYTPIDEYGSYTLVTEQTDTYEGETMEYTEKESVEYDSYGNLLLEETVGIEYGEELVYGRTKGEVTYDKASGYPLTYTVSVLAYDENTGSEFMENAMKVEFSDYSDVTGIDGIATDSDAAPEYYNLQGIRVNADALTPGIYIEKTGNTTRKVRL